MTADSTSEAERWSDETSAMPLGRMTLTAFRSGTFYYVYSAYLVTELVAPWLSSATMEISLYIPFLLSIAFLLLCLPVIALLPDTRCASNDQDQRYAQTVNDAWAENASSTSDIAQVQRSQPKSSRGLLEDFKTKVMLLAVPVFLVGQLRPSTLNVLIQYTSNKFKWKLSAAVTLVSEVAAVNLILFLLVLPQLIRFLQGRYHFQPQVIDLAVVRTSMLLLSVGALFLGLAPSVTTLIV
ncbi:MAG: hypothetical protein OHK93_004093, partial [Ramalina farinacea]|nr:hypothetical protein [Ramalina farinacea]